VDQLDVGKGAILRGKALEDAAVDWVMEYERRAGRVPVDRRYERAFPGDIESPPRIIEIKATAKTFRGGFLWLEPVQFQHATTDPAFHLYLVENVGQGDPSHFTLRVLAGEALRGHMARAVEKRYFEVPWRVADHDSTVVEGGAQGAITLPAPRTQTRDAASLGPASDVAAAIAAAVRSLGGEASTRDIEAAVESAQPGRWRDLGTAIADHAYPGSRSSLVPPERRILVRVAPSRYRLR
jgi:hypothetical protein